jgi:hypothetical protein
MLQLRRECFTMHSMIAKRRISTRTITIRLPTTLMAEVRNIVDGQTERKWRNYSHFIEEALVAAAKAARELDGRTP